MAQHSSGLDCQKDAISADALVSMRPSNAIVEPMRDASCAARRSLGEAEGIAGQQRGLLELLGVG
jgi:hypothetical protein